MCLTISNVTLLTNVNRVNILCPGSRAKEFCLLTESVKKIAVCKIYKKKQQ